MANRVNTGVMTGQFIYQIENIVGTQGNDTISASTANNRLDGHDGDDSIRGMSGNDTLVGGAGNDTLDGGVGADSFVGGAGYDYVTYASSASGVSVDLLNISTGGGDAESDTYSQIERVIGSAYNDVIRGGLSNNMLYGEDGNDVLFGRGGTNYLYGGEGIDRAQYSDATAGVKADLQDSSVNTNDAAGDRYYSIENLYGTSFSDSLLGDTGNNTLYGADGIDLLYGRDGDDVFVGGDGVDRYYGGAGIDRVSYADLSVTVYVDLLQPTTNKGAAAGEVFDSIENLTGSKANDTLYGDSGDNSLHGYDGNDFLAGRIGNDALTGGDGADTFNFARGYQADRILDFQNDIDTIRLAGFGVTTASAAMSYASQVGTDVVFDFGNGDTLRVYDTTLSAVSNDLSFV